MTATPPGDWRSDTAESRRLRLERFVRLVIAVGVALTGFVVAVAAGDAASAVYESTPPWLRATLFTVIVLAGAALALSYVRYEEAASAAARAVDAARSDGTRPEPQPWPEPAEKFWRAALVLTTAAPLLFLAIVWCAAICGCRTA